VDINLYRQLDAGIRALKLNYSVREGEPRLRGIRMIEVLKGLKDWLEKHPSETIYISFGDECSSDGVPLPAGRQFLDGLLADTHQYWVGNPDSVSPQVRFRFTSSDIPFRQPLSGRHAGKWF
jgi:hypothetical protein